MKEKLVVTCICICVCLKKNLKASLDLLSIPLSGEKMSRRLDEIIGCKYKTS